MGNESKGRTVSVKLSKNGQRGEMCTLCNMHIVEDVYHFVAICPILVEHRRNWLGGNSLTEEQFLYLIQGTSNYILAKYCD